MRKLWRGAAVLLVCAAMLAMFSGCGSRPDDAQNSNAPGGEPSGLVWVSEFKKLSGVEGYIEYPVFSGGKVCFSQNDYDEKTAAWTSSLWSADLSSGEVVKLEGYVQGQPPEGYDDGYFSITGLSAAPDGGLWVAERISTTKFNLPEGFDETTQDRYQYAEEYTHNSLRHLDAEGAELGTIDLNEVEQAVQAASQSGGDMYGSTSYMSGMAADSEGNLCLLYGQSTVALLSAEGELLWCNMPGGWWEQVLTLPDGSLAIYGSGDGGTVLRPVDFEKRGFGEDIDLPMNAYNLRMGGGGYLVSYIDSSCVYGLNAETGEAVQLASLVNCDVDEDNVNSMYITDEGEIVCLLYSYDNDSAELVRLTQKDASEIPPVTTLRLACLNLNYDLRKMVLDFNRSNSGVRIEVADYSQYNTEEDYSAGVTKLNAEIISGNVPDIFVADELPIEQYGAKDYLFDLYQLIDSDPELEREDFFPNILKAMESDGKLYSIAPTFGIASLVGNSEVVGEDMGWTLQDMMAVIDAHPEAQYVIEPYYTKSNILQTMLTLNLGEYVDWETGECSFDGQDFLDLLNFCEMFPENYEQTGYESTPALISSGRQLLAEFSATDFESFQMYEAMFGGKLAFKGYPTSEGVGNIVIPTGSRLSISSACKDVDAAWQFVRTMLLDDYYTGEQYYRVSGYPLNMTGYASLEAKAMEKQYETDPETGEQVEVSTSGWSWDDFYVDIYAMTEEQSQQLRELIASAERTYSYDLNIMQIVIEECSDFFSGAKTAGQTAELIQDRASTYVNEQR